MEKMKNIYNVKVYKISHSSDLRIIHYFGEYALVKKNIFGVKEIITGETLKRIEYKKFGDLDMFTGSLDYNTFTRRGCVLGVLEEDLIEENLATRRQYTNYLYTFRGSKLCEKIMKMRFKPIEDKEEKHRKKLIKKLDKLESELIDSL